MLNERDYSHDDDAGKPLSWFERQRLTAIMERLRVSGALADDTCDPDNMEAKRLAFLLYLIDTGRISEGTGEGDA